MFKVGDKVHFVGRGKCVVVAETDNHPYSISVRCEKNCSYASFTPDGFYNTCDTEPSLFHADGYKPPVGGKEPVRCEFEEGEMVLVRDDKVSPWYVSFFMWPNTDKNYLFTCSFRRNFETQRSWPYCIKFDLEKIGTI